MKNDYGAAPYKPQDLTPNAVQRIFVVYLLLLLLPPILLPSDILTTNQWLREIIDAVSLWVPSIRVFSAISHVPEVAACSWAIIWITAPLLIFLNALNPRSPTRASQMFERVRQYPRSRFQLAAMASLMLFLLIYESQMTGFAGGSWLEGWIRLSADTRLWLAVVCTSFGIALGGLFFGLYFFLMVAFSKGNTHANR